MRQHAKEFKNEIQKNGRQLDSKIIIKGSELVLGAEDLFSVTPVTNSTLLKSVMKEVDFESKKQIGIGQEVNVKSGVKVNGEYEYIDYGNYSVYKSEYKAETDTYSHICYDKMLKTMIDYTPLDIIYPINLREYINAIATKCGLEFADKNSTFANYNTSINEDHFSNGNYTFRDVLDYIAQLVGGWLCINDNDELEIRYPELAKNYDKVSGENVSFISNVEDEINTIIIDGKSEQATRSGKNLFNINTATLNSALKWVDGTYSPENLSVASDFIKIEKGKSYISKYKMQIILFNENKEYIGYYNNTTGQYNSFTISTDSECNYVKVSFRSSSNKNVDFTTIGDIQLEEGTTATEYEPYGVMPSPDYPSEIESVGYENLFNKLMSNYTSFSNTITIDSVSDNSITLTISSNGGPYDTVRYYSVANLVVGKTYTVSANIVGNDNSLIRLVKNNSGGGSDILGYVRNNNSFTFTYDGSYNSLGLFLYISHGVQPTEDLTATFSNIQIEEGSQSHSYIPYGKYGIEVKNIGKNLYGDINWLVKTYAYFQLPTLNEDYTLSIKLKEGKTIPSGLYFMFTQKGYYDPSQKRIELISNGTLRFSSHNNTYSNEKFNYISVYSSSYKDKLTDYFDIQLEKGTVVTDYEPYQENTSLFTLNQPLRSLPNGTKDIASIKNNILYVDRYVGNVVLDGSENWNKIQEATTSTDYYYVYTTVYDKVMGSKYTGISNNFIVKQGTYITASSTVDRDMLGIGGTVSGKIRMFINKSRLTEMTTTELKTWLSEHNTQVDYELAEPYTEKIGEVDNLSTFKGINNVSLDANMQTNMTITYPTEYEELDKHFLKDVNVSFSKKYGAVNSVVFSRGNGSDNIYRKDNMSISRNGLTEIKITGNPFLEGNDRENFIQQLFDKINGLEFYIMDVASTGIMYLELGDLYYFNMIEEKPSLKSGLIKSGMRKAQGSSGGKFLCLLMNDEIKITQGLEESIYSDEPEITETNYKTASITDTSIKNAIIQTNKNSAEILLKVNSDEVVSAINLSPENIKISSAKLDIDAIATFTNSKLAEAGSTVINGANITTGSINCDRLNGGTINGQAIRGGSISIEKGVYYFNMGTSTSNPNCSGLNVGGYGVKAYSDITATGFAITDGDTGKSQSINIYDGHGRVWYLTFTGGILTASEYK